ncbi:pH-sensitive adenylate cyclase domain protein [Mycobacterium xenopi 3993]|nr:pH-sensitive adenylate cyclase domain protein [Mycobacterium xenopi 3993]
MSPPGRGKPGRRLVRQPGQRGQPGHRRGRPGTVLVAESAREAIEADIDAVGFSWSFAGARRLKGIKGEVKLSRARRGQSREGGPA